MELKSALVTENNSLGATDLRIIGLFAVLVIELAESLNKLTARQ